VEVAQRSGEHVGDRAVDRERSHLHRRRGQHQHVAALERLVLVGAQPPAEVLRLGVVVVVVVVGQVVAEQDGPSRTVSLTVTE
jgi:hypothetical protein